MHVRCLSVQPADTNSNLRVENLAPGLQMVQSPTGHGGDELIRLLQAWARQWGTPEHPASADDRPPGPGTLTLQTARGTQILGYDPAASQGSAWSLQTEGGQVLGPSWAQEFGPTPSAGLFRTAYLVDFHRGMRLDELLLAAGLGRQALTVSVQDPSARRGRAGERGGRKPAETAADPARQTSASPEQITQWEQRQAELTAELAMLDQKWNELDRQRRHLQPVRTSEPKTSAQPPQLNVIDNQLARWNRTLQDIIVRKQRAIERVENREQAVATGAGHANPRQHLMALKRRLEQLQETVAPTASSSRLHDDESLPDLLSAMHDDLEQLSNDLTYWQAYHLYRQAAGERDQLARCELELRQSIQKLADRRKALLQRLTKESHLLAGSSRTLAAPAAASSVAAKTSPAVTATAEELNAELVRVDEARHRLRRTLLQISAELRQARAPLPSIQDSSPEPRHTQEIRPNDPSEAESTTQLPSADTGAEQLIADASRYLGRLSGQRWSQVHVISAQKVLVEDPQGRRLQYEELDLGSRDQVYLAFCLAVAANRDRHGIRLPMVLLAPFTHYPSQAVRGALEVLREFAANRQVLCWTRFEHVAAIARTMNVPVHSVAGEDARQLAVPTAPAVPASGPAMTSRTLPAVARSSGTQASDPRPEPAEADPSAEGDRLSEHDPLERVTVIDRPNIDRLRRIGIMRVGDLLRIPVSEVTEELRPWGVSSEMVYGWQSQIRLMSRVPGLGAYDARILVGCGVTDPEQLRKLDATTLRHRVRDFSATAEGQAILLSGTEAEFSRVTDWIHGPRAAQSRPREVEGSPAGRKDKRRKRVSNSSSPRRSAA